MFDWLTAILTSIPWAILLIYLIKNPEKVEKWGSIIAKFLSFISLRLERRAVAGDIQADIKGYLRGVPSQTKEQILPYGIKINWVKTTTREAFIKEGKVIVKMRYHKNQARNFLYATLEWAYKGLIPQARHLLDKTVLRAVDLVFINNVLTTLKRYDTKQLFIDEIYEPEVKKGSVLEQYCQIFDELNKRGLFLGVVLQEFSSLGKRTGSVIPDTKARSETIGFMKTLEKLARKRPGEDVSPTYSGECIKCSIVLIAKQETYLLRGLSPYLNWINKCLNEGIRSFYVCAIGDANISIVRKIHDAYAASKRISIVSETIFPLKNNKAIVLHLEAKE